MTFTISTSSCASSTVASPTLGTVETLANDIKAVLFPTNYFISPVLR